MLAARHSKRPHCILVYKHRNFAEKVPLSATFEGLEIDLKPADHTPEVVLGSSLGVFVCQPSSSRAKNGTTWPKVPHQRSLIVHDREPAAKGLDVNYQTR
ncbi:MAG: hypothetical protein ACP5XB_06390, partial [Isosphaeraceae bacterium]